MGFPEEVGAAESEREKMKSVWTSFIPLLTFGVTFSALSRRPFSWPDALFCKNTDTLLFGLSVFLCHVLV